MINGQISKRRVLTLGADPEMFVYSGLKLLPAFEFLPGKGDGNLMYWDGFQAEWKYNHDGNWCQNNLVLHTRQNLSNLQTRAHMKDKAARLTLKNVVRVPQGILDNAAPYHVELGCQPSYNAYGLKGKPVLDPRKLPYRFAGGHMHFGTYNKAPNYKRIVKMLDNILGVWSVGVARDMDHPVRRQYYGLPGEHRMPKYEEGFGVEYRVLSNFWLASPAVMQLTWDIGRLCVRLASSLKYSKLWARNEDETIDVIGNCDVDRANKIITRNEPMFRWMLGQVYRKKASINNAIEVSRQGLGLIVPNPEDFNTNWHFKDQWVADAKAPWARWEQE